jgi:DNA primase
VDARAKYWGLTGFNQVALYDPDGVMPTDVVCLCEGELDALLLVQNGLAAVSPTNGARGLTREHLPLFDGVHRIWLVTDQDEAGRKAAARMMLWFGTRARWITWPLADGKDVTEYIVRHGFEAWTNLLPKN